MKKYLLTAVAALTILLVPKTVSAVDVLSPVCSNPDAATQPEVCQGSGGGNSTDPATNPIYGPNGILTKAINILSLIAGVAAVIVIMIAGLRYVTSSGDPNTVAGAQKTIIYGVVGLVVVALAQVIVVFVLSKL